VGQGNQSAEEEEDLVTEEATRGDKSDDAVEEPESDGYSTEGGDEETRSEASFPTDSSSNETDELQELEEAEESDNEGVEPFPDSEDEERVTSVSMTEADAQEAPPTITSATVDVQAAAESASTAQELTAAEDSDRDAEVLTGIRGGKTKCKESAKK
jgi:hypothetical protein